jgi:hypothetical protein
MKIDNSQLLIILVYHVFTSLKICVMLFKEYLKLQIG